MKFTFAAVLLAAAAPTVLALPTTEPSLTARGYTAPGSPGKGSCSHYRDAIICGRDLEAEADVAKREANLEAALAENPAMRSAELAARGYTVPGKGQSTYYRDAIVCSRDLEAEAEAAVKVDKREASPRDA